MTGEPTRRLIRVIAWLLTPVVAWAASFLGGWLGARIGGGTGHPRSGLLWLGAGSVVGGVLGVVGWVLLLRHWAISKPAARPPVSGGPG